MTDSSGYSKTRAMSPHGREHRSESPSKMPAQAKERDVSLVGPVGLLSQVTRNARSLALDVELTE